MPAFPIVEPEIVANTQTGFRNRLMRLENAGEGFTGKLGTLIGVEDPGGSIATYNFLQRFPAEVRIHGVGYPPGQYLAAVPVHDRHYIYKAMGIGT